MLVRFVKILTSRKENVNTYLNLLMPTKPGEFVGNWTLTVRNSILSTIKQ